MIIRLNLENVPVLYQINNLRKYGLFYFKLDSTDYSLFPYEQEVLLRTGSEFKILDISEEQNKGCKYWLVQLRKEILIINILGLFNMLDTFR